MYQYLSHVDRKRCYYPYQDFMDNILFLILLSLGIKFSSVFKILYFVSTGKQSANIMHIKYNNMRNNCLRYHI